MHISQIYISQSPIPDHLLDCVKTVTKIYPDYQHTIFDHNSLRELILQNFDSKVVKAYDKLIPYSYKADLGKYCLLYTLGGWYFDIATGDVYAFDKEVGRFVLIDEEEGNKILSALE